MREFLAHYAGPSTWLDAQERGRVHEYPHGVMDREPGLRALRDRVLGSRADDADSGDTTSGSLDNETGGL